MSQTGGVDEPWSSLRLNPDGTPALMFQELTNQQETDDDDHKGNPGQAGKGGGDDGPRPPFWN